jgi:DNA-directed RNA polymerase specialized sigma24 family protein
MSTSRQDVDGGHVEPDAFADFMADAEPRLRIALIATYGPRDGQVAAFDALSWAWEHWGTVSAMANPVGYLYRVGQSSVRRHRIRPIPIDAAAFRAHGLPEINPELVPALGRLSTQQRAAVLLVHAFGWTIRDAARTLEVAPSTIQTHLDRGLERLRNLLETHDD